MKCSAARSVRAWDLTRDAERSAQSSSRLCHFRLCGDERDGIAGECCVWLCVENASCELNRLHTAYRDG